MSLDEDIGDEEVVPARGRAGELKGKPEIKGFDPFKIAKKKFHLTPQKSSGNGEIEFKELGVKLQQVIQTMIEGLLILIPRHKEKWDFFIHVKQGYFDMNWSADIQTFSITRHNAGMGGSGDYYSEDMIHELQGRPAFQYARAFKVCDEVLNPDFDPNDQAACNALLDQVKQDESYGVAGMAMSAILQPYLQELFANDKSQILKYKVDTEEGKQLEFSLKWIGDASWHRLKTDAFVQWRPAESGKGVHARVVFLEPSMELAKQLDNGAQELHDHYKPQLNQAILDHAVEDQKFGQDLLKVVAKSAKEDANVSLADAIFQKDLAIQALQARIDDKDEKAELINVAGRIARYRDDAALVREIHFDEAMPMCQEAIEGAVAYLVERGVRAITNVPVLEQ